MEENLLTIRQRWQAATPGEWITTASSEGSLYENRIVVRQGEYTDPDVKLIDLIDLNSTSDDCTAEDLCFIAEAHQDVPMLIDEVIRLQVYAANLEDELRAADGAYWALKSAFDALSSRCHQALNKS